MASGVFFDPMRLLRVAPLIGSTGTLVYATAELVYNSTFLHPSVRKQSDEILPKWWKVLFHRSVWVVLALNMTTSTATIANLVFDYKFSIPTFSTKLYCAGLAAAVGHLFFVPWVAGPIQDMLGERTGNGAASDMGRWLGFHRLRLAVADFPAWVACLGAFLSTPFY
ncbi:uncharacterized protein CIMG_05224 [Coccidioides immitis RS]|uniref:Integral membrane protein n=2 Tax=Coccidioides TaxID=5500 RepID=A0A0E1RZ85_COCIM|nr:uncharacterized protein CIMG_05224 [Coccidioides immitis RS]EAS34200.1 integral membrane protein [Coccidioides immitis RS]KMM70701.1 hypothetical protein CPAG_07012 [Coccidioides posadasii RMSCC 3488]